MRIGISQHGIAVEQESFGGGGGTKNTGVNSGNGAGA